jgi:hypothetical protein
MMSDRLWLAQNSVLKGAVPASIPKTGTRPAYESQRGSLATSHFAVEPTPNPFALDPSIIAIGGPLASRRSVKSVP